VIEKGSRRERRGKEKLMLGKASGAKGGEDIGEGRKIRMKKSPVLNCSEGLPP